MGRTGFSVPLFVLPALNFPKQFSPAPISDRRSRVTCPWAKRSRTGIEIGAELRERLGHIFAAVAEANVLRLVVDGSRQQ